MKKPQVPLAQGLHVIAVPLMKKYWEIRSDLPIKHLNGDIYFGKKEIKSIYEELKQKYQADSTYPEKIEKMVREKINNLKQITKVLEKEDASQLNKDELLASFMKGYSAIAELTAFMSFKGTVQMSDVLEQKMQELLKRKIRDGEERNNIFLLLSLPKEKSLMAQEQKSILEIAKAKQVGKDVHLLLKEHCKRFNWMSCVMYAGEPYDEEHFRKEIVEATKNDCKEVLRKQEERKKKQEIKIKDIIKELQFTKEETELLEQFRIWVHLRTYIKDMTSLGMLPTLSFLKEIAKKAKCSKKDLLYLSHKELLEIFTNKRDMLLKESAKRQKGWGFTLIKNKAQYYNNKNLREIEESEEKIPVGVKGFAACKGIARGKAIVVKSVEDLERIQQDDILITHMTTTNFVPVLSKVAAIVTDEGGITCHAAIISREMNIPCIIGTKIATKAFKDGDIVEVDANTGIVRKIK
ncbi:MAG: PEP-utilizing enzyme [Nanoarchaeota archaeon]